MKRRTLFKYSLAGLGSTMLGASLQSIARGATANSPSWGYLGQEGPEFWGSLAPEYQGCGIGRRQSPIDLTESISAQLAEVKIDYQPSGLKILNNGHTIEAIYDAGSFITLDNRRYELVQFHFHRPSEHLVDGSPYDMELHLVHQDPNAYALAVLGILLKQGKTNSALEMVWEHMPMTEGPEQSIKDVTIDANQLIPSDTDSFYHYYGSLTTPPCSEIVDWLVYKQPIEVSAAQIAKFADAIPFANARPAHPLNNRFLLESP